MLLWLKDNLAMRKNALPMLCGACPCQELIFPDFFEMFPFWEGLGDYSIGWANAGWDAFNLTEYDPDTGLWIDPPYFECAGDDDKRQVYFFGFTEYLWASSTGRDPFATGAKKTCIPGLSECPPPPYYFNLLQRFATNPKNGHSIRFDYSDLPEKLADSGTSRGILVKPEHIYTFKAYDIDVYPEELLFEGKIAVHFSAFEIHIHDIEMSAIDYYAYAIDYGDYPYEYKSRTVPFSVYDMDDNLVFSSYGWNEIAAVHGIGCWPDVDYSILGKCNFSGNDCSGCLKNVEFKVTTDFVAQQLAGDCKNIANIDRKGSYSYSLLGSGFETRAEANDYLDSNYSGLYSQMKTQCEKSSWHITGTCECTDDTCSQCMAVEGSVSIKCEDEIKGCYEKSGKYYKDAILADGRGFPNFMDASEYLSNHSDEIDDELTDQCPECQNGKFYGIHIYYNWHDGIDGGSCLYGFPYTDVWNCNTIIYYRNNPDEFAMMYGEEATWEIAAGPFETWDEPWVALKNYRININRWPQWECKGDIETDYFCLSFFKTPDYRGGGTCLGGSVYCRWGYQYSCGAYGSRKFLSVAEDPSCKRC